MEEDEEVTVPPPSRVRWELWAYSAGADAPTRIECAEVNDDSDRVVRDLIDTANENGYLDFEIHCALTFKKEGA